MSEGPPIPYTLDDRLVDAVFLSDLEEARALLTAGADPDARDVDDRPVLHMAIAAGDANLAQALLSAGADPDARDVDGWIALHVASVRRAFDLVWLLCRHGADANAQDGDGNSALWRALLSAAGRTHVAELLRRSGGRDDLPNHAGVTPAEVARRQGFFLQAGVSARSH